MQPLVNPKGLESELLMFICVLIHAELVFTIRPSSREGSRIDLALYLLCCL